MESLRPEPKEEHIRAGGWNSHSVLATVLLKDPMKRGKLLLNRLGAGDYHAVLADELVHGAIVNQNQAHWIALVKHKGQLWHVDSKQSPRPMDEEAFRHCLRDFPDTFAVTRHEHLGD